jgi:hypothetical protein
MAGVTSSLVAAVVTSFENASLGALPGLVVEVTQFASVPVCAVVQPAGKAGATTLSNASVRLKVGWPTRRVKFLVTDPRLLLMLTGMLSNVPQGVFAGTV